MARIREKMDRFDIIPEHVRDALVRWDMGEGVMTVEMGGLGPGYEQCIQITVFELIRDNLDKKLPDTLQDSWGQDSLIRVDKQLGLSGAQAGSAQYLAYVYLRDGWRKVVEQASDDRRIQVSKEFPHLKEKGACCHG